jgi:hypothetical protein
VGTEERNRSRRRRRRRRRRKGSILYGNTGEKKRETNEAGKTKNGVV